MFAHRLGCGLNPRYDKNLHWNEVMRTDQSRKNTMESEDRLSTLNPEKHSVLLPAEWRGTLPSRSLLVIRFFDKWAWWALQSSTYLSDVYTAQFYSHSLSHVLFQLFLGYAEALPSYATPLSFISLVIFWAAGAISGESVPMSLSCGVSHNGFRVSIKAFDPLEFFLE